MKIPFTLDAWLKDRSQKVETRDGSHVVETIYVDLTRNNMRVMALFENNRIVHYYDDGRFWKNANSDNDLFIVTPEPKLSEFEKGCIRLYQDGRDDGFAGDNLSDENLKESAAELLALAREELLANDTVLKEYAQVSREQGKADAMKDLPRWRKLTLKQSESFVGCRNEYELFHKGRVIALSELEKLPSFNDD